MKIQLLNKTSGKRAGTLVMVLVLAAVATVTLVGILSWAGTNTNLTSRNNQYIRSQVAAEAAVEKVLAKVGDDYQNYGITLVVANLNSYRSTVPTGNEYGYWNNYRFMDESGAANHTSVDWLPMASNNLVSPKYKGLKGYGYNMRIVSQAQELGTPFGLSARVEQSLSFSMIPVFQYAIFYNEDLEFNRCAPMVVTGPVHCNATIYGVPFSTLDFKDQVTASGKIKMTQCKPGDPQPAGSGTTRFYSTKTENVPTLNLPLGTNNTSASARQIIEMPPAGENPASLLGQLRYYNQADMIITVSNNGVLKAYTGLWDNFATTIPSNALSLFVTNMSFTDQREQKSVKGIEIDIDKFRRWNCTNQIIANRHGDISTLYVVDQRANSSSTMYAVRLANGQCLPPKGLSVATSNPLYVKGNYNVCTNASSSYSLNASPVNLSTTNTSQTKPASFASDAITFLSANWDDATSTKDYKTRIPAATTVNAAILAGNSVTTNNNFGGGVHNLPRFLENWDKITFYINGSIVSMFPSQIAIGLWSRNYYAPPDRYWGFDSNFSDPAKLPPATPQMRLMIRGKWKD
jgi:hypothetical protein